MGYLQLSTSGDTVLAFNKALISLWFRVPQAAVDMALGNYAPGIADHAPPFAGVIPLLIFGNGAVAKDWTQKDHKAGIQCTQRYRWVSDDSGGKKLEPYPGQNCSEYSLYSFVDDPPHYDLAPSYIGVFCGGNNPVLDVNFQMTDYAAIRYMNDYLEQKSATISYPAQYDPPPDGYTNPSCYGTDIVGMGNGEAAVFAVPEFFRTLPDSDILDENFAPDGAHRHYGHPVAPDKWHHLLLSYDLSIPCNVAGSLVTSIDHSIKGTVNSAPQLYIAFDNHNLTQSGLTYYWPDKGGPNDWLSVKGMEAYDDQTVTPFINTFTDANGCTVEQGLAGIGQPEYSYQPESIDFKDLSIPSDITNYPTEMAEFQLFGGIILDTGNATDRHFFIKDGKPVNPAGEALPGGGIKRFKYEPTILLHGVNNWKQGRNTGSFAAKFLHFDKILKFKPEPELGA